MKKLKKFFKTLGPGFITGASDDDPSGIATYSQAGSIFGYSQAWTALFSLPFMVVVQEMCGRIGLVTGKGLAGVLKTHYSKRILYGCVGILLVANTINIGADLGAMAASAQLLIPLPFSVLLLLMTAATLILEIFVSYKTYTKYLKYLTLSLFAYIISAFVIKQDWQVLLRETFIPQITFSKEYLFNIVAILGTTISPYLFFWEASQEVEEEVAENKLKEMGDTPKVNIRDIRSMRVDTISGMFFSNLIMFFIIVTTATTLFANGIHSVETATQAAQALRPLAGDLAYLLFTVGVIGTGMLAVPVLAGSASYAFSEAFGWKEGLYKKLRQAHGFYAVITIATLIGLAVNFTSIKPFTLLYYTAILNGLCAPPLLVMILLIANNKKILGQYTNKAASNIFGIIISLVMAVCSVILILSLRQ